MKENKLQQLRIYKKMLFTVDMVNGFVKMGALSNKEYLALLPEQTKIIEKFQKEKQGIAFIRDQHEKDSVEFRIFPPHCVIGTGEELLIDELSIYKKDAYDYPKNSTNAMFSPNMIPDLNEMKALEEVVIQGVCFDICDTNFAISIKNYFDQQNRDITVFVVKSAMDTFDGPDHNKNQYIEASSKLMTQAGIILVDNFRDLERKEKQLGLKLTS